MSRLLELKGAVAFGAAVCLMFVAPLRAQEAQPARLPTIADCPRGYVLAVQDLDTPMPLNRADPSQASGYSVSGAMASDQAQQAGQGQNAAYAAEQAEAPRAFVTGCVLPQPAQPQAQQQENNQQGPVTNDGGY